MFCDNFFTAAHLEEARSSLFCSLDSASVGLLSVRLIFFPPFAPPSQKRRQCPYNPQHDEPQNLEGKESFHIERSRGAFNEHGLFCHGLVKYFFQ
jgi:hypothetical protein